MESLHGISETAGPQTRKNLDAKCHEIDALVSAAADRKAHHDQQQSHLPHPDDAERHIIRGYN